MPAEADRTQRVIDTAIRLGVVAVITYACIQIVSPFLLIVAWAIIIAVAVHPLHLRIESALGGRTKWALAIFALVGLGVLIVPTVLLGASIVDGVQALGSAYDTGTLRVPPAPESVAEWPVVGEKLYAVWSNASTNLTTTIQEYSDELAAVGKVLLGGAAGAGATVVQFVLSVLIAAALMGNAAAGAKFSYAFSRRLAGHAGEEFADLAIATTRSVAQGVLGVAMIQAILAGVGMLAVGVPAAGIWAVLVLVLAVVQLPPIVILGPVIAYVFTVTDTVPAVLFAIWGVFVSVSDTFLKPLLLGRGLDIPMLVILIGAIGGMMSAGVIGLFVGAVMLALAYKLFMTWLDQAVPATGGGE